MSSHEGLVQEALELVNALMSQQRKAFCAHGPHRDLSLPQLYLLLALHDHGAMTLSELGHMHRISAPSASALVDRMEEKELVRRVRDDVDRRVVHVEISERGRAVVDELVGMRQEQMQRLFGAMTEKELRDFICGVTALRAAATRLRNNAEAVSLMAMSD